VQSLRKCLLLIILIIFTNSYADENDISWSGSFSTGTGYDSYIPSLGRDSTKRIGSKELLSDIGINLDIYDFSIGTSLFVNGLVADKWRQSQLTGMINAGWSSTFGEYDLSFSIYGTFAGYDFDDFRSYYTDWSGDGEIFFNHSDDMSFFFSITGGYTHGIDSTLKYLRGPYAGFSTGEYFYFGEFDSYVRIYGNANFNFYDDISGSSYPYLGESGISSLSGKNRGIDATVAVRGRFNYEKLFFIFTPTYRNSTMFDKDVWEYSDRIVKKRRVDHALLLEFEPGWSPDEDLTVSIYYLLEKNFSTLGKNDYTDENYIRHNIRLLINYDF